MSRPARARLSAQALLNNFQRVRDYAPGARIMAVVKANGYGHGLAWMAAVLKEADAFAVASVEEGIQLRNAGATQPVCLLCGFFDARELHLVDQHRLSPVIHDQKQLRVLQGYRATGVLDVWLKVDTGMHRLGFAPDAVATVVAQLKDCRCVRRVRIMSHLANADDREDAATQAQAALFRQCTEGLGLERSLANSAGISAWPDTHLDWVRPGIMLYGASPLKGVSAEELGLKPAMTLESRLIAVQMRDAGDAIGYGGDWVCPEPMPVGVAAMGYGDGYPRHAGEGTPVLVNGRRVPLVGRVSMDLITLDLRSQPQARAGDPVILWGEGLPVDEVAARAGTIAYEPLCQLTGRVPRMGG